MTNWVISVEGMIIFFLLIYILTIRLRQTRHGGQIVITQDEDGKKTFSLEVDKNPDEIEQMRYILFKVTDETSNED